MYVGKYILYIYIYTLADSAYKMILNNDWYLLHDNNN
jgi:hypothetical protein